MTWSPEIEREYGVLLNRLEELRLQRAAALCTLTEVLERLLDDEGNICITTAIDNADELRDALAPFDDGIRVRDGAA